MHTTFLHDRKTIHPDQLHYKNLTFPKKRKMIFGLHIPVLMRKTEMRAVRWEFIGPRPAELAVHFTLLLGYIFS